MRHRRNEYGNLLAILGTVIMSVFISELMGQAKQWWQADISTRTGMKKSTSNVIEKAEPTVRKTEKKGDGEMRFKKQLASTPDIEGTKKKSRVKPSIREILSQIGGVLLIIAMFLAFAVAVVALLEQLFGFPWGRPLMERLGTPALIIIVVALWLSDPKRMALLMHQIIQLLFACSCAVGVLLYARTGGAVQEDQAMALLFCVLGIPGLASFIFSITRRRDADDILKFRKTTFLSFTYHRIRSNRAVFRDFWEGTCWRGYGRTYHGIHEKRMGHVDGEAVLHMGEDVWEASTARRP